MKRGGSKMGYTEQFNLLSPCYKDGEQPEGFHMGGVKAKPTKKGKPTKKATKAKKTKSKQRGGSSCGASPSVSEMGVVDTPASLEPTKSELAWDNRMKGGDSNGAKLFNQAKSVNGANLLNKVQPANGANLLNKVQPANGNSKNSPLNKIKNEILPPATISGFALIVTKISKNKNNFKNDKYSINIISKIEDGNTQIKQLGKSEFSFYEISSALRDISKEVFPTTEKTNNVKVNAAAAAATNGTAAAAASTTVNAGKNGNGTRNGTRNGTTNVNTIFS